MGNGIIKFVTDSILSLIYSKEESCIICNSYSLEYESICKSCFGKIQFYNKSFKIKKHGIEIECLSSAYYSGVVVELIRRLKYKSDFNCGEALSEFLIKLLNSKYIDYDIITYVPMTKKAFRKRGYNQSRFLAVSIGRVFNKPVKDLIKKIKDTKDQIGLDDIKRWENLNECFKVKNKKSIQNKNILLVDDVITTGATAFLSSKELLNNGANKVIVLTVAKSRI